MSDLKFIMENFSKNLINGTIRFDLYLKSSDLLIQLPEFYHKFGEIDIFQSMIDEWTNGSGGLFAGIDEECDPALLLNCDIDGIGIFYRRYEGCKEIIISSSKETSFTPLNITVKIINEDVFLKNLNYNSRCLHMMSINHM